MTTVKQCLTRALRMNSQLGQGEAMDADDAADALIVFNETLRGMFGVHIGGPLVAELGATMTAEPGYLYLCGISSVTLTTPDNPQDGWRFGVADAGSFSTSPITLDPNGSRLGGVTTNTTVNTAGEGRTYFYRADAGNWELERDLTLLQDIYLPDDMIGSLTAIMAEALAVEYGSQPTPLVAKNAANAIGRFRSRYGKRVIPASYF